MVRHSIAVLLITFVLPGFLPTATAQFGTGLQSSATIDRDVRVFAVVAALNAAGFDVEFAPQYYPVRQVVREQLESLDPDLRARLAAYYSEHRGITPHEDELARYISLALNLTYPPAMEFVVDDLFVPPDARDLSGFVPLLNDFYIEAQISRLWVQLAPAYDAVLDALGRPLRETIVGTEAYLRVPAGTTGGRQLVAFLELSAPVNSVHVRNYSDNMYMVFGFTPEIPAEDVRHAYLHLVLDPVIFSSREELEEIDDILDWLAGIEGVRPEYADDFHIMVSESLIRAVELRMDSEPESEAAIVDTAYRIGLLLTPFFMERLEEFEQTPIGMREYFRDIVPDIDVRSERSRFDDRFHAIELTAETGPRAEVPAAPQSNPVQDLLFAGQDAFNSEDDRAARNSFQTVVDEFDSGNGPALYGLALIASREGDPDAARSYFAQTVASDSAQPPMTAWSHVFLGRILDIECEREAALAQYQAAVAVGTDTNGADEAARSAIQEPFGGDCEF